MKNVLLLLFLLGISHPDLFAQRLLELKNPSFEDQPRIGTINSRPPMDWYDCGHLGETAPDIHSGESNFYEVSRAASDGQTYLGLVTRNNETWERIGQRLSEKLVVGKTYTLTIDLAKSDHYISRTPTSIQAVEFDQPTMLRVWAGDEFCDRKELLIKTEAIENKEWESYNFDFIVEEEYGYLVLEAFPVLAPLAPFSNGHILLDNLLIEVWEED